MLCYNVVFNQNFDFPHRNFIQPDLLKTSTLNETTPQPNTESTDEGRNSLESSLSTKNQQPSPEEDMASGTQNNSEANQTNTNMRYSSEPLESSGTFQQRNFEPKEKPITFNHHNLDDTEGESNILQTEKSIIHMSERE